MQSELTTCFQLLQSLIASYQQPQSGQGLTERIIDLEDARQLLSEMGAAAASQRQQYALELLQRQLGIESSYSRRSESIQHSGLAFEQQQRQLEDLLRRYRQARERFEHDWPELDQAEAEALPVLLLRESIEQEINQVIARIRGRQAA